MNKTSYTQFKSRLAIEIRNNKKNSYAAKYSIVKTINN